MAYPYRRSYFSPVAALGLLLCLGGSTALGVYELRPWERAPRVAAALEARLSADATALLDGERQALHPAVAAFYAARAYAPAWADPAVRDTLLALAADAAADGLDPARLVPEGYAALSAAVPPDGAAGDGLLAERDLLFSDLFVRLGAALARPGVGADSLYRPSQWRPVPRPPPDLAAALAGALAAPDPAGGVARALDGLRPRDPQYRALRAALARALAELGDDGTEALLRLNLERWRWLPDTLGDFHVFVNLPAFALTVRARDPGSDADYRDTLRMRVVIGKHGWSTTVMSDTMTQVDFNPTWSIPPSIQRESYGYYRGRMVRPPGPGNPLGRVKFLFPNEHAVYLHDTPSRASFGENVRAYSHGCVRLHRPDSLAITVMAHANGWAPEDVEAIWRGPWRHRPVALERPVPVHLVYFTAWADDDGRVTRYADVYGRDAPLAAALGLDAPAD